MSDAVVATLTAGEQAHLIEQRREVCAAHLSADTYTHAHVSQVRDKFNEALFSLYIIKGLGQRRYAAHLCLTPSTHIHTNPDTPAHSFYDPEQYLKNMKIEDATFNTDIPGELKRIETMLRQNKLEQQWKKEGRANNLESDEVDPEEAMSSWVHQQLEQGACSEVQLKLPYKKKVCAGASSPHPPPRPVIARTHDSTHGRARVTTLWRRWSPTRPATTSTNTFCRSVRWPLPRLRVTRWR